MRGGVEIWVSEETASELLRIHSSLQQHKHIVFDNVDYNTSECVGIFSWKVMDGLRKKKEGYWICEHMKWHSPGQACDCSFPKYQNDET